MITYNTAMPGGEMPDIPEYGIRGLAGIPTRGFLSLHNSQSSILSDDIDKLVE